MVAAQQKVHDLFNSKVSDPKLVYEFNLFDKSVTQKLWSARYYYEKMSNLRQGFNYARRKKKASW